MTKNHLFSAVSVSGSAFAVWIFLVTQVPPKADDILIMATFFVSLAVWLGSLSAFLLYKLRVRQSNREVIYAHITPSIRQGLLIGATVSVLLYLQFLRVLSISDAVIVMIIPVLFELALRNTKKGLA